MEEWVSSQLRRQQQQIGDLFERTFRRTDVRIQTLENERVREVEVSLAEHRG